MILDVFTSIFTADTAELKKGYEETQRNAKGVTEELKKAESQSDKTGESLVSMAKKAAGFLLAAVASGKAVGGIINQAEIILAMNNFSESVNTSIEDVDAFGKAITALGSNKDEAEAGLKALFASISKASQDSNSKTAKSFKSMGVSLKNAEGGTRDLFDVLMDVSGAVEGMDTQKAKEYINSVGITDRATIEAMLKGREELERLMRTQKELGVINKESAEKAIAFDKSMGALSNAFARSKQSIAELFLPALTSIVSGFAKVIEWAGKNKEIVTAVFASIAAVVLATYVPAMTSAAVATLAATWPILLLVGALALAGFAIWALWDDFKAFKNGNDSFLADLLEKYPALGRAIKQTFEGISFVINKITSLLKYVAKELGISISENAGFIYTLIDLILGWWNLLAFGGEKLVASLKYTFGLVVNAFKSMGSGIKSVFTDIWSFIEPILGKIVGAIGAVADGIKWIANKVGLGGDNDEGQDTPPRDPPPRSPTSNVFDGVNDLVQSKANIVGEAMADLSVAQEYMIDVNNEPLNSVTSNQIQNSQSSSQSNTTHLTVGDITIETQATDAKGVMLGISSALEDQLKSVVEQNQTGIAR